MDHRGCLWEYGTSLSGSLQHDAKVRGKVPEAWKKRILCSNRGVSDPGTSKEASDEAAKVASKGLELPPGAVWNYYGCSRLVATN